MKIEFVNPQFKEKLLICILLVEIMIDKMLEFIKQDANVFFRNHFCEVYVVSSSNFLLSKFFEQFLTLRVLRIGMVLLDEIKIDDIQSEYMEQDKSILVPFARYYESSAKDFSLHTFHVINSNRGDSNILDLLQGIYDSPAQNIPPFEFF